MKPNFIVIGAARSGTTSLFQYLDAHPDVFLSPIKELNFFSNPRYWNKGVEWYESRFKLPRTGAVAIGEASTSYTKAPFTEDVPKRIFHYNPDCRLIYIVRNPIERYISHYMQRVGIGTESRSFEETLENLDRESVAWQGKYFYQLQQYLQYFDRQSLFVTSIDHLQINTNSTVREMYQFLGVDYNFIPTDLYKIHNAAPSTVLKSAFGHYILSFYRQHMEQRRIPNKIKKAVRHLGDLGGRRIDKPTLSECSKKLLIDYYSEDMRKLQEEFGIQTQKWQQI